jgi:hypothetical protein
MMAWTPLVLMGKKTEDDDTREIKLAERKQSIKNMTLKLAHRHKAATTLEAGRKTCVVAGKRRLASVRQHRNASINVFFTYSHCRNRLITRRVGNGTSRYLNRMGMKVHKGRGVSSRIRLQSKGAFETTRSPKVSIFRSAKTLARKASFEATHWRFVHQSARANVPAWLGSGHEQSPRREAKQEERLSW